jgi:hypothetical protein
MIDEDANTGFGIEDGDLSPSANVPVPPAPCFHDSPVDYLADRLTGFVDRVRLFELQPRCVDRRVGSGNIYRILLNLQGPGEGVELLSLKVDHIRQGLDEFPQRVDFRLLGPELFESGTQLTFRRPELAPLNVKAIPSNTHANEGRPPNHQRRIDHRIGGR